MNTYTRTLPLLLLTAVLFLAGCASPRTWDPANPPSPTATAGGLTKRIVIFAPVQAALIAEEYPAAGMDFARSMARRADFMVTNVEAWVGETLPVSDAPRWNQGPLGAAAGAHNVVLTSLVDIQRTRGTGPRPGRITATVLVRILDADGEEVWANEFRGFADDAAPARAIPDSAQPVAKAAWDACDTALWGLKRWFDGAGAPGRTTPDRTAPLEEELALIDVHISSLPEHADIFVDDIFRGTTPTIVPLPVQTMTVRIERAGFLPWQRELRPSPGMRIQPALQPIEGPRQAVDSLPLPSEGVQPDVDSDPSAVIEVPLRQPSTETASEATQPEAEAQRSQQPAPERPTQPVSPLDEIEGVDLPPVE